MEKGEATPSPPKLVLLLQELRAPFLTASVVPVVLGTALAFYHTGLWHWSLFLPALAAMALLHCGANVANDYYDHLSGNDEANVHYVRPFTGGSRMIQNKLLSPREVLALSVSCFALGGAIGVYLVLKGGVFILALGLIGALGGFFYTAPPLALVSRGVGELVIAVNFGILPVAGAYYLQTRKLSWDVILFSLPVAMLIAAVLFINQFQDYEADRAVGKRHWVVRLGRRRSVAVYALLMSAWTIPIAVGVLLDAAPRLCLVAIVPFIGAIGAMTIAKENDDGRKELAGANGLTVLVHMTGGLLLALAFVASRLLFQS